MGYGTWAWSIRIKLSSTSSVGETDRNKLRRKRFLSGSFVGCMVMTSDWSVVEFERADGRWDLDHLYRNISLSKSSKLLRISTAWRQRNRVGGYLKDRTPSYGLFKKVIHAENASVEFNLLSYVQSVVKTSTKSCSCTGIDRPRGLQGG